MGYAVKASMELKAEGAGGLFSGYASTYNLDLQNDKIQPGAFAQSIADKKGKVPIFFNHEDWIGLSTSLAEDGRGLAMTGELALGNSIADNAYALMQKAAALDFRVGMSIGFTAQDWEWDGNVRTLKEINLYEVSITPFPAQPKAFVNDVKTLRNLEKYLRDAEHFSRSDAKRFIQAFAASNQSCGTPDANQPLARRMLSALVLPGEGA